MAEFNADLMASTTVAARADSYDAHADLSAKLAATPNIVSGMVIGFSADGSFVMLPSRMSIKDSLWLNEVTKLNIIR